jgi:actin-related protein
MAEEQAETVEADANEVVEEQESIDHEALQDQRLEEESQRQISTWLEQKGIELPEGQTAEVETEEEPVPVEAPQEPDPPPVEEKPEVSKKFLQVAKRERELFRRQQEVKAKEAEFKKYEPIEQSIKRGDHVGALEALGGSYEAATTQVLGKQPEDPKQADLEARLNRLETEKTQLEANQKVNAYTSRLKNLAESNDEYGITTSMWDEAKDILLETSSQYAKDTGKLLDDHTLLGMVEEYYAGEAEKLLSHPRFKRNMAPTVAEEEPTSRSVQRKRARTLSTNASRASVPAKPTAPLTQDERLERALGVFRSRSRD